MKIKLALLNLFLFCTLFATAQITASYHESDSTAVPVDKPIVITYPEEVVDTSGDGLDVINLTKYILFASEGKNISHSAFQTASNEITIIPHDDMKAGGTYYVTISPLKYKASGKLSDKKKFSFKVSIDNNISVETAYMTSFSNLIMNSSKGLLPLDTIIKLESHLLPEKLSYLNKGQNQVERMKAVAFLYDAIARNPELQDKLLIQAVNSLGCINDILPLSAEAEAERMNSLAMLLMASARQPEVVDTLNLLTDTLLGVPDDFSALSDMAKVMRMESLGIIFESIARQPIMFRTFLEQAVRYYGGIDDMGETNMEAEASRMMAFAYMFQSIARQPMALDSMIIAADTLLGIPEDFKIFSDEVLALRMKAFEMLFDGVARQPEMADTMLQQAVKYMGRFSDLNDPDTLSQAYRMQALRTLWQSMARQPEASEKMCSFVDTLMGIPDDFSTLSNIANEGRIMGISTVFESISRQPEIADTLISKAVKYCGSIDQIEGMEGRAKGFNMYIPGFAFQAIARQPEAWDKIELALDTLILKFEDYSDLSDFDHEARARAIEMLFESISRNPEYCDTLLTIAEDYLGTFDEISSIPDEWRIYPIASLIMSMGRQFEIADTLDYGAERLIGVPENFKDHSDKAILLRSDLVRAYMKLLDLPENELDYIKNIIYKYFGKWEQINKENKYAQMARIEAVDYLINTVSWDDSKTTLNINEFESLLGRTEDFSLLDEEVKYRRQMQLIRLYESYLSKIETTTADSIYKVGKRTLGFNSDCPVETWKEAEMRMEMLAQLFEEFSYGGGFVRSETDFHSQKQSEPDLLSAFGYDQNNISTNGNESDVKGYRAMGYSVNKESLEKFISIIEDFSGDANFKLGSNNKIDYFRQIANTNMTIWLKSNDIHDTLIADARERILGSFRPEKPKLYGAPSDGSVKVKVDQKLYLLFTDVMYTSDSTLIHYANIQDSIILETLEGEPVAFDVEVLENNRTICITPSEEFTHGMKYRLSLPDCFTNFADSTANAISNQFRIEKALLKITAEDKVMDEGAAVPELTMLLEGFVDGDTEDVITKPEISTEATSTSVAGTYPITITGGSSEKYTFEFINGTLTILSTIGIDDILDDSGINIYPNPVVNTLQFEKLNNDLSISKLEIISQSGQIVYCENLNESTASVNISELKSGIYFVRFILNDQTSITKKVMKK